MHNKDELRSALDNAFSLTDRVIIEPLVEQKRELECGYLQIKGKELFTKCGEILCEGFYDYQGKYGQSHINTSTVADLHEDVQDKIREYSRRLVRALGVTGIARIDYFLSGDRIYFNEINTMPGFTEGSLYPKMIEAAGFCPTELVNLLIEDCLAR